MNLPVSNCVLAGFPDVAPPLFTTTCQSSVPSSPRLSFFSQHKPAFGLPSKARTVSKPLTVSKICQGYFSFAALLPCALPLSQTGKPRLRNARGGQQLSYRVITKKHGFCCQPHGGPPRTEQEGHKAQQSFGVRAGHRAWAKHLPSLSCSFLPLKGERTVPSKGHCAPRLH